MLAEFAMRVSHGMFFMPWVRTIGAMEKPTAQKPWRGHEQDALQSSSVTVAKPT